MIRFSTRALIYFWYLKGGRLFLFEKQPNVQNKILTVILKKTMTETVTVTNIR